MRYLNEMHQKVLKENVKLYILRFLHLPLINTGPLLPGFQHLNISYLLHRNFQRILIKDGKVRQLTCFQRSLLILLMVLPSRILRDRTQGLININTFLFPEKHSVFCTANSGTPYGFHQIRCDNGSIGMQGEHKSKLQRIPQWRNQRSPLYSEVFNMHISPVLYMCRKEGRNHLQRLHPFQLFLLH